MRVLVVEDNRELALSIKKGLEQENISVDLAYDGEAGEEKAFVNAYDGILLDLNLPRKDGLAVLQSLRASAVESPIIIITVHDEIEERAKILDFCADDYLVKPLELLELNVRLSAVVRRHHGRWLPQVKVGTLTVDHVPKSGLPTKRNLVKTEGVRYFTLYRAVLSSHRFIRGNL